MKFWDGNVKPSVFSPILWAMVECPWSGGKMGRETENLDEQRKFKDSPLSGHLFLEMT